MITNKIKNVEYMPTVKRYQDEAGLYIRSNIDGKFVTLQLSPQAEGLISDLGYKKDNQISWDFLQPLCDCGHVYTNNSEPEISNKATDLDSALSSNALSDEEKQRISDFLEDVSSDNQQGDITTQPDGSEFKHITEEKKSFIRRWSSSEDEYETNIDRITKARDSMGILNSVSKHAIEHPIRPNKFRVSSQGVPIYSFDTGDIRWIVHDFREIKLMNTDAKLFFSIQPGTDTNQSITVEKLSAEWHTSGSRFSKKQVSQFISVFPDILYYINNLPNWRDINPSYIITNPTAELPEDANDRISAIKDMQSKDRNKRVIGTVLSTEREKGGRVRGHTGYTYTIKRQHNESKIDEFDTGVIVSFDTESDRGSIYAKNITNEQSEISASKFIKNWPNSHDKSISWVRDNWFQHNENDRTMDLINNQNNDSYDISLEVDSLAYYVLKDKGISVNKSVRILLEEIIDNGNVDWAQPAETTQVTATISADTLSMVDLAVEMSPSVRNRSQFVNSALRNALAMSETTEITFCIPQCYYEYMLKVIDQSNTPIEQLGREAIEKILIEKSNNKEI